MSARAWCDAHADYSDACGCDTPGPDVLDDVLGFLRRFVAFPSVEASHAVTLWCAHAHAVTVFESTPRLAVLSPEPGSGKSRVLETVELLVPRPIMTLNATANALFRLVTASDDGLPTLLIDEADTIFGPRASKDHEDLRGFVNGGHRRGALAYRCVVRGKSIEVEAFQSFAPVALAGLDDLPDTIMTRAVVVRMRKRAPGEHVEPYRHRFHAAAGYALRDRLAAFVSDHGPDLIDQTPDLPPSVVDRAADVWEPLVTIADAAGGVWPARARAAASAFVGAARETPASLGVRLLSDIREAFATAGDPDRLTTPDLIDALTSEDESPWATLHKGRPIDARGVARRLAAYGIRPDQVRDGMTRTRGYHRADFVDAWSRYCPSVSTPEMPSHPRHRDTEHESASPHSSRVTDASVTGGVSETGAAAGLSTNPADCLTVTDDSAVPPTGDRCSRCVLPLTDADRLAATGMCAACEPDAGSS